jgi:hypothetical protein
VWVVNGGPPDATEPMADYVAFDSSFAGGVRMTAIDVTRAGHPDTLASLNNLAVLYRAQGRFAETQPLLRETLTAREKAEPNSWATFSTKAMLGATLLGQKLYAEAELLLLAGYAGLKQHEAMIPAEHKRRLPETATDAQRDAIAAAAKELDALRTNCLNPPDWTKLEILEFPGSADGPWRRYVQDVDPARGVGTVRYPRTVPKDTASATRLKERTLTNFYNTPPSWLTTAHQKLDAAAFAAYGWPAEMTDDDLLARLLALNLSRASTSAPPPDVQVD